MKIRSQIHTLEPAVPLWLINVTTFGFVLMFSVVLVRIYADDKIHEIELSRAQVAKTRLAPEILPENPFADLHLEAKAALAYDMTEKRILYGYHEEIQLPLASLTKIMTALVASESLPDYTSVPIVSLKNEKDAGLHEGDRWALKDLISYTLISSSNVGAHSIASAVAGVMEGRGSEATGTASATAGFVSAMNTKAKQLGLAQTYFLNSTGLDGNGDMAGAYGSPMDMAILFSYLVDTHPQILTSTIDVRDVFSSREHRSATASNTDILIDKIPGLSASKTGLTDLAGGNLAIVFDASFGQPIVIVVLGSSEKGRFDDVEKLVQATITYLGTSSRVAHATLLSVR